MTITKLLTTTFVVVLLTNGCNSEDALLSVRDGSAGSPSGSGGTASGGAPGLGGATSGGVGGMASGSGGTTSVGLGSGGRSTLGSGGMAVGTGGDGQATAGSGGAVAGTGGGSASKDAGGADAPADLAARIDSSIDAAVECAPGYPVGSSKPAGDGCNTCVCILNGVFACTTAACPPQDAALEAGQCPAGQVWCPGCTPGTGSCGAACTGMVCPTDAAPAQDTSTGTCSKLSTQAECDTRSDCHSVFYDPGTCGCASPGCCARFSACKDGAKAVCTSPSPGSGFCDMATPFCESPYVISYTSYCYEGCVLNTRCGS